MRRFIDIINEGLTHGMGDRQLLNHEDPEAPAPDPTPNLPATINQALARGEENHFAPKWFRVSDLPPPFDMAVRRMGPMVFRHFTRTPVENIEMMADFLSGEHETKHMMEWIADEGERLQTDTLLPGHVAQADCVSYRANGYDFLLVRDGLGHYIYAWPSTDALGGPASGLALPSPE